MNVLDVKVVQVILGVFQYVAAKVRMREGEEKG